MSPLYTSGVVCGTTALPCFNNVTAALNCADFLSDGSHIHSSRCNACSDIFVLEITAFTPGENSKLSLFHSILALEETFSGEKIIFQREKKKSFILNGNCKRCSLKLWIVQIICLALLPKIEPTGWWQLILRLSHSWFLGSSPSPAPVCCPQFRGFTWQQLPSLSRGHTGTFSPFHPCSSSNSSWHFLSYGKGQKNWGFSLEKRRLWVT